MEAIKLVGVVKEDGLLFNDPELRKFLNQEVDVIVYPKITKVNENHEDFKNKLLKYINIFDTDDINSFSKALDDCRKINPDSWK